MAIVITAALIAVFSIGTILHLAIINVASICYCEMCCASIMICEYLWWFYSVGICSNVNAELLSLSISLASIVTLAWNVSFPLNCIAIIISDININDPIMPRNALRMLLVACVSIFFPC